MDATSEISLLSKPRAARELDIAAKVIVLPDADVTLEVDIAFETASVDEAASKVDEVAPKIRITLADDVVSNRVDGVIDSSSSDVPALSEEPCRGLYAERRRGNLVATDRSASGQEVETPEGKSNVGISALNRSLGDVRYEENSRELNCVTSMNWNARQAESARTETEIGEPFLERTPRTKERASSNADSEKSKVQRRVSAWEGAVPKSHTTEGSSKTGKGPGIEKRRAKGLLRSSLKRRMESMERRLEDRVERIWEENVGRHPWLQPIETWIVDRCGPTISHIPLWQMQQPSEVVTIQPTNGIKCEESNKLLDEMNDSRQQSSPGVEKPAFAKAKEGITDTYCNSSSNEVCQAVDSMTRVIKSNSGQRNKFTEGLDFASIVDWTSELRPSMKKLRQAMDGLLKTARLTHSVFRVQEDSKTAQRACNVRYRRDVCFSQALTALVTGIMAKLWCQRPDPMFLLILTTLGPLVSFEGLLSYYGDEIDMWGDMAVAVEDTHTVTFTLSRCGIQPRVEGKSNVAFQLPLPRVVGSRSALTVILPVPDAIYSLLPLVPSSRQTLSFNVTPVFFNVGINEMASLAESLGTTKPQEKSNMDNFDRLNEYYLRFKKLNLPTEPASQRFAARSILGHTLSDMMSNLKMCVQEKVNKNVEILQLSSQICRRMRGLRFTSCKSAKDRTGMSITLEQVNILSSEYHLAEHEYMRALDCMRSEGCRRENTWKNIGVRKYAFNSLQILTLPRLYRPPTGTYGSAQT